MNIFYPRFCCTTLRQTNQLQQIDHEDKFADLTEESVTEVFKDFLYLSSKISGIKFYSPRISIINE